MAQPAPAFGNIDALQIINLALPPLKIEGQFTKRSSLAGISYGRCLMHWHDFERLARDLKDQIDWSQYRLPIEFMPTVYRAGHTANEHFVCGDEKSSSARLVHNLFQVVGAVGSMIGIVLAFGDWKATAEGVGRSSLIPDFAILNPVTGRVHAVGETKTPWAHPIEQAMKDWLESNDETKIRLYLGQIAEYMLKFQLKYGFLSTYRGTLFIKQEYIRGKWVLAVSNLISSDTSSVPQESSDGPLIDKVSLRECMLYFLHASAQPDFKVTNSFPTAARKNPRRAARYKGQYLGPGRKHNLPIRQSGRGSNPPKKADTPDGLKAKSDLGARRRTSTKAKPKARTKRKAKARVNN